ncbi:MAG TPA: NAD-glutamate dehydrogenase domain-containing protein [Candidatus Binataceae bacterium]|nr:NAD-glutamate dehydrogenase domain-containing protein [Candidatus Binataceae bacterium]
MSIAPDLHQLIETRIHGEDARRLALFAERLFARETPEFRERTSNEERLAIAQSGLEFFGGREQPVSVRISKGSGDGITIVESVTIDRPFIVDSLLEYFHALGAPVRLTLHPIFRVARDDIGKIESFESGAKKERPESFVHAELETNWTPESAERIDREIREILIEVCHAADDFDAMTERALMICDETASIRELVEVRDFLRWLVHGGFVFLGYRRYRTEPRSGARALTAEQEFSLGILGEYPNSRFAPPSALDEFSEGERRLLFDGSPLIGTKTHIESHVHRRRAMDSIMIRRIDSNGKATRFDRFVGLLASKAFAEEAQHIPILRAKLSELIKTEGAVAGSHDFKEIVTAFNSFPKEELFRASVEEIRRQLDLLLEVRSDSDVRLSLLSDPNREQVIAMVLMPREAFSAEVRIKIQNAIENRLRGKLLYYYLALGEGYIARLHFGFHAEPPSSTLLRKLESEIASIARTWDDRFREHLGRKFGGARAHQMLSRWGLAFTPEYKAAFPVERAAADAERVERLLNDGGFEVELNAMADVGAPSADSELRMHALGDAPILSELMPMLQNFGIRVLSEDAHQLMPLIDGKPIKATVESFRVQGPDGISLDQMPGVSMLTDAICAVRNNLAENDPINALTLTAGLRWREVALVRAYLAAAFQMRLAPARPALRRVFLANPELARILVELFCARLTPTPEPNLGKAGPAKIVESKGDRPTVESLNAAYLERLGAVDNIADDRIARAVLSMVEATVRTNYFLAPPQPDPYNTLKFESAKILGLADTVPMYEIHVNSPRMEGCHLRAGRIARGGIRYSDRLDDFRTEILSLMKTQTVKNDVIVPTGAKGGFIVKQIAAAASPTDGVDAYKTLMHAMLDITDNLSENGIVHPPGVKVLDQDGAYLVVAADKGTASFSDLANGLAIERGFWLGDAFASGGEHGYDHKKMGITARGAWESGKRHLREIDRDAMRGKPVTVIGIGDMSGDVFGNGLIYSNNLKLIAAFDHRHIFIDPDPDPMVSFEERKRLYELPRSSWADYNPTLISKGGGVFKRGQKRVVLSPEIRAALSIEADALDSDSLLRAILRAPVDLFYNGGIGTYVRASDETDAEVGDHANDSCRITASELRVKIVVEGGNLGFTQRARIEYALGGGMINTDAIDNSAGVDTSDHEVNLKILLEPPVKRGALSFKERNKVLASCEEEVAARVLGHNRDQALSLSLEQRRSRFEAYTYRDLMQAIEERGLVRKGGEDALPSREELSERRSRYPGLTRPELSIVTAYTKINLTRRLEDSPLADDPYLVDRFLRPYFPPSILDRFADEIVHHRLRRELIATAIVNELVDVMGSIFIFGMVRDQGVQASDAIRAWIIARDVIDLRGCVDRIRERSYLMSAEAEVSAFLALERATKSASEWATAHCEAELSIGTAVEKFGSLFRSLSADFESMPVGTERDRFERIYRELRASVNEEELAHDLARLAFADHILSIIGLSLAHSVGVHEAAQTYFGLGDAIDFATIEAALANLASEDTWERRAIRALAEELGRCRTELTAYLLVHRDAETAIDHLKNVRPRQFADAQRLIAEVKSVPAISLAALQVVVRSISQLAQQL